LIPAIPCGTGRSRKLEFETKMNSSKHNLLLGCGHMAPSPPVKRCRLGWRAKAQLAAEMEIRVCSNRSCRRQGSFQTLETLSGVAPPNVTVKSCGCLGRCGGGPNLVVLPDGLIYGHCGTVARAAELIVTLFAQAGHDPKTCLDALALRKRADIEFANRNFTQAELLLSQVHAGQSKPFFILHLTLDFLYSFFLSIFSNQLIQAIDLKPFGGLHITFKCRFAKLILYIRFCFLCYVIIYFYI